MIKVIPQLLFTTQVSAARLRQTKPLVAKNHETYSRFTYNVHKRTYFEPRCSVSYDLLPLRCLTTASAYSESELQRVTLASSEPQSSPSSSESDLSHPQCFEGYHVVLFGWLGAQPKYLEKYADLWKSRGAKVLPYTPPITATLFPFQADRSILDFSKRMGEHVDPQPQPPRPQPPRVIYHVFSNGGFLFLGALIRATQMGLVPEWVLGSPSGIIIDSAPGEISVDMAARGVGAAAFKEGSKGFEDRFPFFVDLSRSLFQFYLNIPFIKNRIAEVKHAWEVHSPTCPQLFLFSEEDVLIPPEDIERFMLVQRNRGVQVSSNRWQGTLHVEHYREYPEEYIGELKQFVKNLHV